MSTNEVQYRATKAHAARFHEALQNMEGEDGPTGDKRRRPEVAAVRSELGDLEAELAEYEQLGSGALRSFNAGSLPELAVALVKAESTGYASTSLARLCDVVGAPGVEVREEVSLPSKDAASVMAIVGVAERSTNSHRGPSVAESFQPARRCSWSWSQAGMVENTPVAYRAGSDDTAHRGGA